MGSPVKLWEDCLSFIRERISEQSYRTWFEPIKAVSASSNILTIQVPNQFFYEWLEEHYISLLRKALTQTMGDQARLEYQILLNERPQNGKMTNGNGSHGDRDYQGNPIHEQIKNPFVIPGIRKLTIDPQLNPNYTLENFIEGDCNRLARSAGKAIAQKPGGTAFNPLVIFGDVGLGKTHLAQAIGNDIVAQHERKNVLYVNTEKFTNQIIQSIKTNSVNELVTFYQMLDILIIDDIHFLANRTKTQEIFFHIFNQLHQSGKQIVITSDRPPKDLEGMEERLISRFKWGLSADLQAPDLETRMAILQVKMEREGVDIPDKVVEFICYNIKNNIRELEGILVSLMAQASINQRKIDIDLAKEVIENFVKRISKEITLDSIQALVAEHFSIPVERIQGKTRKREVVMARQLSMYLAKNLTEESLKNIGESFGGRDHSTVIYSIRTVKDLLETDLDFKTTVSELEKRIRLNYTS